LARTPLRPDDPTRIGHYRLTARLGAGGMGVVYLGVSWDGAPVAVKVLRPELAGDEEFRRRFGREVAALVQVKGVCTVRVIEADSQSATPFVVTEYAQGPSLSEYIDKHGSVAPDMLFGLATGLAEALTTIHAVGIMHRDLKPSNIILTDAGPKVIDFGIARRQDTTAVTRTGMMIGSMGFMAPEQISGHPGPEADIFAWGVTVAYAAGGRSPFGAGSTHSVLYRIMYGDADIASVPDSLLPLVEASLAKDPQSRPSARQLLDRLTSGSSRTGSADDTTQVILARTWQSGSHASPPADRPVDAIRSRRASPRRPRPGRTWRGPPPNRPPPRRRPPTYRPSTHLPPTRPLRSCRPAWCRPPRRQPPGCRPPPRQLPRLRLRRPKRCPSAAGWPRSPRRPWSPCACAGPGARTSPSADRGPRPGPFGTS
jgi:serine/threonine protein kinase